MSDFGEPSIGDAVLKLLLAVVVLVTVIGFTVWLRSIEERSAQDCLDAGKVPVAHRYEVLCITPPTTGRTP